MGVRDNIWEDPRHRASYVRDLSSLPEGYLGDIDPSRFSSTGAYYAAQYGAYEQYLLVQQYATLGYPGSFSSSWALGTIGETQDDAVRARTRTPYDKAWALLRLIEGTLTLYASNHESAATELRKTLRRLELAIEAFEEGDESEKTLGARLGKYSQTLDAFQNVVVASQSE